MRIRTLALALAMAVGATGLVQAKTQRTVVHKSSRKAVVHKRSSKIPKGRKAPKPKVVKHG